MKCTKKIVITAFKVQYVDLREEKPRTPQEEIYTIDKDWADAMGLLHLDITDAIRTRYERAGYKAFSIERIKPKCEVTLDLGELYTGQLRESVTDRAFIDMNALADLCTEGAELAQEYWKLEKQMDKLLDEARELIAEQRMELILSDPE